MSSRTTDSLLSVRNLAVEYQLPNSPRNTLAAVRERALKTAKALENEGIRLGDRIATMAWNTERHVEAWFGIMGIGAICHTLNPRLFPEQLVYIVNHAEDRVLFVDLTFLPLVEALQDKFPTVEKYIVLTDGEHMPDTKLANVEAAGMGGGMEHASAIFYGSRTVNMEPSTGLVTHEIAHQWFGDSVTESDWDDVWLSEGFATFVGWEGARTFALVRYGPDSPQVATDIISVYLWPSVAPTFYPVLLSM